MKRLITTLLTINVIACSQVETGEIGIKTNFGKVEKQALSPGMYFYFPGINSIHILNTKVQTVNQDSNAASKDLQNVQTQITLNYHLGAEDPVMHYVRLGDNQSQIEASIVKPAMSESFKAVVAKFTAEELVTKREEVSKLIIQTLGQKLKQYDLFVDSTAITSFQFSPAYANAVEQKQVAEQEASRAKNLLQKAQIEAQQKVVEAKARAEAMQLQKQVVTPELLELKRLEIDNAMVDKWDGKLPETMLSNNPMTIFKGGK